MFLFHMVLARRTVLTGLALAAAALLCAAAPASADQGWRFYGGQTRPGYDAPANAGFTYNTGSAYYRQDYYSSDYSPPAGPTYDYAAPAPNAAAYAYGAPVYYQPAYSYANFAAAQTAGYYGSAASTDRSALIDLRVPAGAVVRFDGKATTQTGTERRFVSPPLQPGRDYTYDVRVEWKDGDRTVERTRTVDIRAGARVDLDFTRTGSAGS